MRRHMILLAMSLIAAPSLPAQPGLAAPAWVRDAQRMKPENVPAGDYPYLAQWIANNAKPPEDYFLGLYKRHDVIIFGEGHNVREHKEFIIHLLPRLYHQAGVRCIGWEFTNPSTDAQLERLVTAPQSDPQALLDFARTQVAANWNSKEHWDLIEAVRKLNASLPEGKPRMRMVGIDITVDWTDLYIKIKTVKRDTPEGAELQKTYLARDVIMAENAARETLEKGVKALLFVGRGHDETHVGVPPDPPYNRPIMGGLLHNKYGERVFQVAPDGGEFTVLQRAMEAHNHKPAGFDLFRSPFATILSSEMGSVERPLANLARGYIYFGKCQQLHGNTPIKGFVTEEMYRQHRRYYEIDYGVKFDTAKEFDEYLQGRRWKIRCPAPR